MNWLFDIFSFVFEWILPDIVVGWLTRKMEKRGARKSGEKQGE